MDGNYALEVNIYTSLYIQKSLCIKFHSKHHFQCTGFNFTGTL